MKCVECDQRTKVGYEDPRDPPVEEGPCLCEDCYCGALEGRIYDLEDEMSTLQKELDSFTAKKSENRGR